MVNIGLPRVIDTPTINRPPHAMQNCGGDEIHTTFEYLLFNFSNHIYEETVRVELECTNYSN